MKNRIRNLLGIGMVSLVPFLVQADTSLLTHGQRHVIKVGNEIYRSTKISDRYNKIDGWYITDSKGNVIGDKKSERTLYRELACSSNIDEILPSQLHNIRESRNNIREIIEKKAIHDISKFVVEQGSFLEGILLNEVYAGGTSLPKATQKKMISIKTKEFAKDFMQDIYDGVESEIQEIDNPEELEELIKKKLQENVTLQLLITERKLENVERALVKKKRTPFENKRLWNDYIESNSKLYAYSILTNKLMEDSTCLNISKNIARNLSLGGTGYDFLDKILQDKDFSEAFLEIDENLEKIRTKNQRINDRCTNQNNPEDDRFLDFLERQTYNDYLNDFLKQRKVKQPKEVKKPVKQTPQIVKSKPVEEIKKPVQNVNRYNVGIQIDIKRKNTNVSIQKCPDVLFSVNAEVVNDRVFGNYIFFSSRSGTDYEFLCNSDKSLVDAGFNRCTKSEKNLLDSMVTIMGLKDSCYFYSGDEEGYRYTITSHKDKEPSKEENVNSYQELVTYMRKLSKELGLYLDGK